MNARGAIVAVLAVIVIAVAIWRCGLRTRSASESSPNQASGSKLVAGAITTAARPRPDPKTLARGSLAGTVTDEAKAPIANARVCADGSSHDLDEDLLRDSFCATTDDQGRYKIEQLLPAKYTISAAARTFRPGVHRPGGDRRRSAVRLAIGEHKTGLEIQLRAGGVEITGTVADLTGGPIAQAKVWATGNRWSNDGANVSTETDAQGAFTLWVNPGNVSVVAAAEGYTDDRAWLRAPGTVEILLTPESTMAGTVVDAVSGSPVAGARVQIGWSDTRFTDDQGAFRFTRLAPGRHVVTARTDHGYGRTEGSTRVGLGEHVDGVVVKLFPAHRIEGKVVIAPGNGACDEPGVSLSDPAHDRRLQVRAEADGTVWAEGVLPGTYAVEVWCRGYQSKDKYDAVVVADQDVTGLVWEVEPGATIRGKVVTKSGQPVEDASVSARSTGGVARARQSWGGDRSTREGAYELIGMRPGSYKLEVQSTQGVGAKDGYTVAVAAGATVEQDLVIEAAGTIVGTVVDSEGKPVGGIDIRARALSGAPFFMMGGGDHKSDSTGAFTIEALRAGDYRVLAQRSWNDRLRRPGTTDDSKQGEKVTVRANAVTTVKLVVESQTGVIEGVVIDAAGAPVADAFVSAARESDAAGARRASVQQTRWTWDERPMITGTDGTFTLTKLSPGAYTVRAYRKGGGEAIAEHVAIGSTAKLQIKATGSIEGVVRRPGGALDEIEVSVHDPITGFSREEGFFRTDGRFILRDLPGGTFKLDATAEDGTKQIEVELAEGERKTGVVIELEELVTLTGRVVEAGTQQPVPKVRMFAQLATGGGGGFSLSFSNSERDNITDEAGRFTIKNAPKGKLMIRGWPGMMGDSDYTMLQAVKTIEGSGTIDLGDLTILKKRVKDGEPTGELGINFAQPPPGTAPEQRKLEVSFIDPAGPAARTELKVGDIVTSVDGTDVTGAGWMTAWALMRAPPGTKVALGLARGVTVHVVLAAP